MRFLGGNGYVVDAIDPHGELVLGGACHLHGAVSPNTGKPLTQFAQLTLSSVGFTIPGWDREDIHLLYSWRCAIHEGRFSYQYKGGGIEIIEYCHKDENYDDFPYADYPEPFEAVRLRLRPLRPDEQATLLRLNDPMCDADWAYENAEARRLSEPMHQFGGTPYLVAESDEGCLKCGQDMPLMASIGNQSYSNVDGFVGNDFVQVLYWVCANCKVVTAQQCCD